MIRVALWKSQKFGGSLEEEKEKYCPECNRTMPPDLTYCPICGSMLETEPFIIPRLLNIASIMATGATAVSILAAGSSFLMVVWAGMNVESSEIEKYSALIKMFAVIGLLDTFGSCLGVTVASYSLRKRRFKLTVAMIALLPFIGLLNLTALNAPFEGAFGVGSFWVWGFGIPIIILSLLSLIFIVIKQQEFK